MTTSSTVNPANCQVFIQIWVDVNALQQGQTAGVYIVDNQVTLGSTSEGTVSLNTIVQPGNNVCWSIQPIDPQYNGMFSISGVNAISGWNAIPASYNNSPTIFTGQLNLATVAGNLVQGIECNYNNGPTSWSGNLPATVQFPGNNQ